MHYKTYLEIIVSWEKGLPIKVAVKPIFWYQCSPILYWLLHVWLYWLYRKAHRKLSSVLGSGCVFSSSWEVEIGEVFVTLLREEIGNTESSFIDFLTRPMYFPLGLIFFFFFGTLPRVWWRGRNLLDKSLSSIGRSWLGGFLIGYHYIIS